MAVIDDDSRDPLGGRTRRLDSTKSRFHVAKQGTVNWAIVGLGDIVRKRVASAILQQPDSSLYACVTRDPHARNADLESLAPTRVYRNVDRMLADPNVHAVYLATPVHRHAPHAIAGLKAGKDVLVEKPMALDAARAGEMCRVARQTGRRLAVAYYRRFWSRFQLVQGMLEGGDFGQVISVRMALSSWYHPDRQTPGAWRTKRELSGGGVLADVGCHRLDLLAWWFDLPRRLVADVRTLTHDCEVEDSANVLMELAGGAQFTGSFHWNSKHRTDEIRILGTDAEASLYGGDDPEVVITRGRDTERRQLPRPENGHQPLVDDFARAVIEDRPPQFTGPDGMKATQIIEAIYRSSQRRTWVDIP
ncbi:MAG TPA: Gfo/Idh/MocA family oxidoreductase [Thermoguttaceae bacterium]|nr:Gfo/Idh/MocA family oxidoreductase [Thermoguttaceae bacterium]